MCVFRRECRGCFFYFFFIFFAPALNVAGPSWQRGPVSRWLNEEVAVSAATGVMKPRCVCVSVYACASQLRRCGGGEATHVLRDALEKKKVSACQAAAAAAYKYVV